MTWTPLHALLGSTETGLTFSMITAAITERVAETGDLEFKRQLPLPRNPDRKAQDAAQTELAKDIAAMANSGGGMIIYGLDEDRAAGHSVASRVHSVGAPQEQVETTIRQVAGNVIQPPVRHLEFHWLVAEPADAQAADAEPAEPDSVLVLLVPDSPDLPHLIHPAKSNGDWFVAPRRDGPHTRYMGDLELQSAYVDRERGQRRIEQDFEARYNELLSKLPGRGWIVMMAVPESRRPRQHARLTQAEADYAFRHGFAGAGSPWGTASAAQVLDPARTRTGLRRFVRRYMGCPPNLEPTRLDPRAYAELHDDGTVALALTRAGWFPDEGFGHDDAPMHIHLGDVRQLMLEFGQLLWAMGASRPAHGPYRARLVLHPEVKYFRHLSGSQISGRTFHELNPETDAAYGYGPIDSRLSDERGSGSILEAVLDMIEDAYRQAGHEPFRPGSSAESLIQDFEYLTRHLNGS